MSILSDWEIKHLVEKENMIEPFVSKEIKEIDGKKTKVKENDAILLTTEKDYLRIDKNYRKNINFLKIIVEIENKTQFIQEIKRIIWKSLNIFLNL